MAEFTVHGRTAEEPATSDDFAELYGADVGYVVRREVEVAGVSRGDTDPVVLAGDDDDVVEVEDTDGIVAFYRAATLAGIARGTTRGAVPPDVTAFLDQRTRGEGSRIASVRRSKIALPAGVENAVRELDSVFGPELTRSGAGLVAGRLSGFVLSPVARKAVETITSWVDAPVADDADEAVRRRKPKVRGLYEVDAKLLLEKKGRCKEPPRSGKDPYLVLLHGTFSHTEAAFGRLRGTREWERIVDRYEGRVLAFEHATLGQTPAQNALDAVRMLPGAPLHLVSHSRGGLVGEVLSYAARHDPSLDAYAQVRDHPDRTTLPLLREALRERDIRVERFVRVACPAMGTTLASGRIDRWASFLFNVFNLVPVLRETGMAALVKKFLLTMLEQRTDPRVMPGLEAQMPESPFLRMLLAAPPLDDGLGSIAGDVQGRGVLNRLLVRGADLFYGEDHDFVVPTSSMSGGAGRTASRRAFFQGPSVNHGGYFANEDSRQALENWLAGNGAQVFEEAPPPQWPVKRGEAGEVTGEVLLVPDLFGSTLACGGQVVWPDLAQLVGRRPKAVLTGREGIPDQLVDGYSVLQSALGGRHALTTWRFDSRRSLDELAAELARDLRERLRPGAPHVVAHGAGCLVLLAALASGDLRSEWNRAGGRAVLLGPPLDGSWLVGARLEGRDKFTAAMALLDHSADAAKVGEWLSGWPILHDLLPVEGAGRRNALMPPSWTGVSAVYGSAEQTVCGKNDDGEYEVSPNGDGFAPRPADRADRPATWFALVPHADLPSDPDTVSAVLDLLAGRPPGKLLADPTAKPGVVGPLVDPRGRLVLPTAAELVRLAWGGGRSATRRRVLKVGVVHGDLRWEGGAVLVGHQDGTPISGAEKALDSHLKGALERRAAFRQYPGRLGTCEVFDASDGPAGMVIGLGDAGDLTPGALTAGVTQAVLRLAAIREDRTAEGEPPEPLSISAVLVGTALVPPMPVENSLTSIVSGVRQANRRLDDLRSRVVIDELKIVELYEERAIQATKAAVRLAQTLDVTGGEVVVERRMLSGFDGKPGAPSTYREGIWRTVRIVAEDHEGDQKRLGALSFTSIGRSARAEQRVNTAQRKLLDALVTEAMTDHHPDEQLYNTLYELLVPNSLKGQGYGSENLLLLIDEEAGALPLEMLASRSHDLDVQPLAVEVGVIRRLETRTFAETTRPSSGHAALVVGDPARTGMPALPAAREEARQVARLLRSKGYDVTSIIGDTDDDDDVVPILNALFRHEYRIVHIAGHGHFDPDDRSRSGVVIGDGVYLSALEIAKMRTTPDVVFLNCCHLGAMRLKDRETPRADQLASSISRQLIENGVRAVIAAGWAVDDQAAFRFATTMYGELLDGNELGIASLNARKAVWEHHRSTNTWGAYQVYGPPAFRLDPAAGGTARREELVAPRELADELEALKRRAEDAPDVVATALAKELEALLEATPREWLRGRELAAAGDVWALLARYENAVTCYEAAQNDWDASGSVRSFEQLLNIRAKWAVERIQRPDDPGPEAAELLRLADSSADLLLRMGRTPERHSLRGSVARRRALCAANDPAMLTSALIDARDAYQLAVDLYRERNGSIHFYPALNVVVLGWLVRQRDERQPFAEEEARRLIAGSTAAARAVRRPDFWSRVTPADAMLADALISGNLDGNVHTVAEEYFQAFAQSSLRARAAVLEHIDLALCALTAPVVAESTAEALRRLRVRLAAWSPQ
ncbi:CHAT domain-containing protein [Lentzea sp.]|uniref:CHAT domain-containing protein n=1 Tax=Lentzea sp. TaxID=56099 RepID=UPI002BACBFC9|nr:CHAT domain-containing protein [Lentzea sp.]HUQ55586.1 CHAT domain-containing protein [Lentzea sp.]